MQASGERGAWAKGPLRVGCTLAAVCSLHSKARPSGKGHVGRQARARARPVASVGATAGGLHRARRSSLVRHARLEKGETFDGACARGTAKRNARRAVEKARAKISREGERGEGRARSMEHEAWSRSGKAGLRGAQRGRRCLSERGRMRALQRKRRFRERRVVLSKEASDERPFERQEKT